MIFEEALKYLNAEYRIHNHNYGSISSIPFNKESVFVSINPATVANKHLQKLIVTNMNEFYVHNDKLINDLSLFNGTTNWYYNDPLEESL